MEIDFRTGRIVRKVEPVERTMPYRALGREDEAEQRRTNVSGNGLYQKPLIVRVDNKTGPDGKADGHLDVLA